ncbi:Putative integral membrane protein [Streptomyces clavuligerus]|uniref:Putative integral membrane protein n=1 Tax=Streptomyces clavuligerus TaxID=1901 RepID=E2Q924_STRCL|nr:Putative integral membrane protein [Streptomyces clavuligerus]
MTAASAGVGVLLLSSLGFALAHPGDPAAALRLAWCAAPLAAAAYFAVTVARTDPGTRPRGGFDAFGLGPARLTLLAVVSTALTGALGSVVALLLFVRLRGNPGALPAAGVATGAAAALPAGAVLVLLALAPLVTAVATGLALRPRRTGPHPGPAAAPPGGLPWGCALVTAGLAVGAFSASAGEGAAVRQAGTGTGTAVVAVAPDRAWVLVGWTLTALGLACAGPSLTRFCGRLLQAVRPGAVRLLAGRVLMAESHRIGRPLGVLSAVAAATVTAWALNGTGPRLFGPLTGLGAGLVLACTTAALVISAVEARQDRAELIGQLRGLGAPAAPLRLAALLRVGALLLVFVPVVGAVGMLATLPAGR